jgi:cytochrome c biogenesis protein ResB
MKKLFAFLSSTKLAIGLIAYLALASALSTLAAPRFPFFSSPLFIVPAALFIVNLAFCSTRRILREIKKKRGSRRHGPDLLHAGLLVLAIGAIFSLAERREAYARLAPGDSALIDEDTRLLLIDAKTERYADGRPRDYLSSVAIIKGKDSSGQEREIRVNAPLRVGELTIYQSSRGSEAALPLTDASGSTRRLLKGDNIELDGTSYLFSGLDPLTGKARVEVSDQTNKESLLVGPGDALGPFSAGQVVTVETSGLKAVSDPGFIPALIGAIIASIGIGITLLQRLKDERA